MIQKRQKDVPYSETLANGDKSDDTRPQEIEHNDPIADDDGFVKQFKQKTAQLKRRGKGHIHNHSHHDHHMIQMGSTIGKHIGKKHYKPSDEVANGDKDDDKQLEDENDDKDPIVDDNGFSH